MKISRKARKLLSVVLTVVLAIGTFQFAPGVRTIAKAADAPEAGQSYTLNFAKAFSEKTQLNGYTSEDGVFKVISENDKAYWHDGQHGAALYNGDKIEVKVAGGADISLGLCKYGHATSFKITDAEGKEIGSTSGKATTDGDVEKVSYSGEAATLTITCVGDGEAYLHSVTVENYAKAGEAESFTMMLDDIAKDGVVATGDYKYGESTLTLVGQGETQYTVKSGKKVTVDGKEYDSYTAGKRHADSNNIPTIPVAGDGTLTIFTPAAKGTLTVYFNSSSFLRVHDYNTADGSKNGYTDTDTGITSYTFAVIPGHTYVMSTTGKTNNMFYAGYQYIVDKEVSVPVKFNNVDAKVSDSLEVSVVDANLGGSEIKLTDGANADLLEGHTYKLSTNDGGVRAAVGDSDTFTVTGEAIVVSLYDVPDVTVEGKITGTPEGTVTELSLVNMVNGREYKATVSGDTYTCSLKPGEYNTNVVTTNGGITHDRVSVKTEGTTVNEVYVELPAKEAEPAAFKSEINVPEDYATLNEASDAILNMQDRPEGEAGRVTINLNTDIFEQTVMAAPYVTLKGNNHTISWYYGVGTNYYSVDPVTGLYNEVLARDKYSYAEGNGSLWGGVFIVRGNNFIAEDTTFKNTYNYEVTEAEKTDIAGSTLAVDRLAENADVTAYVYKERSNAFYIDADNIECYNCKILSSQDTLGRNGSANYNYHTYFRDCVIGGNVDYICGEFAAVFDNCELQWKTYKDDEKDAAKNNAKLGYITAAKTSPYVFRDCKVTTDGVSTGTVTGYYGRTWGASSNVTFIRTQTNGYILEAGWGEMSTGDGKTAIFKEYANLSGENAFVSNGEFSKADNQTEAAVADYIETDKVSAVNTVLGWIPVHYAYDIKPVEVVTPAESDVKAVEVSDDVKFVDENNNGVATGSVSIAKETASEEQVAAVKEAAASAENVNITDKAEIVDISLKNEEGNVIKLSNGTLKISLKKDADVDYTKYTVVVYHLKDDNTLEKLDVTVSDDAISFVTGGLSPFVIDYVEVQSGDDNTPSKPDSGNTGDNTPSKPDSGNTGDNTPSKPDSGNTGDNTPSKPDSGNTGDNTPSKPDSGNTGDNTPSKPDSGNTGDNTSSTPDAGNTTETPSTAETTGSTTDTTATAPKTADTAPVALYLLLVFAAMMACTTVVTKKRVR
jgi:pectin methylesterase-like acyl-CoA thioesterase